MNLRGKFVSGTFARQCESAGDESVLRALDRGNTPDPISDPGSTLKGATTISVHSLSSSLKKSPI
jgi:hypothetical protein